MKRVQSTLMASLLTVILSSVALAGNIGGMRTTSTDDSAAREVTTSGNIGGPKSDTTTEAGLSIVGNIGGLLRVVFSTSTIW